AAEQRAQYPQGTLQDSRQEVADPEGRWRATGLSGIESAGLSEHAGQHAAKLSDHPQFGVHRHEAVDQGADCARNGITNLLGCSTKVAGYRIPYRAADVFNSINRPTDCISDF